MNKVIVTLVGPTCSGKTTLKDQLLDTERYIEVISHTTRPKRIGEQNGETYHFVTRDEFDKLELLERVEYNGNCYGGSVQEFEKAFDSGQTPVIIVEPHGNRQININADALGWTVVNVWVGCPVKLQAERLIHRLIQDYEDATYDGSRNVFGNLITEYTNRLVSIQTVENLWQKLFVESVGNDPFSNKKAPAVLTIPEFTVENEDEQRNRIETVVDFCHKQ